MEFSAQDIVLTIEAMESSVAELTPTLGNFEAILETAKLFDVTPTSLGTTLDFLADNERFFEMTLLASMRIQFN